MVKLPEARIAHITSGRLRIKISSKKGNTRYFESLERKFSDCDKVQKVEANAVTAGMLLLHDADIKDISKFAEENRLFKVESRRPEQMVLTKRIKSGFEDLNRRATRFTGGELDLPGAVFVSLLSISIYQIARGNFFAPAWYTSLWYAVNMVFKSSDSN
ncbi:MAG: hypothetical protein LWW97_04965 [Deltaproteobacteria bacterium]|nr:hypothetical protein [Deltaproteobacteria bacterium]